MPVQDHAVHDKVKIAEGKRYGCWGRPLLPTLVNLGDGMYPFPMSRSCRHDMHLTDPRCADCPTPKDTEYLAAYGLMKERK